MSKKKAKKKAKVNPRLLAAEKEIEILHERLNILRDRVEQGPTNSTAHRW